MFTGCFEGGIYVLAASKDGTFAAPEKLLDKAGNILRLGQYWDDAANKWAGVETSKFKETLGIGATAVDWDEDGDLDLILGGYDGNLFVRLNEGSAEAPAFATESIILTNNESSIALQGRDAIPKIADWDGDGLFDILSGSGEGGVYWWRNEGSKGAPSFSAPQEIIPPPGMERDIANPTSPGDRTQVCATDYDDDGDLDLLVGDFNSDRSTGERHGWVWLFRRR